MGNQKDNVSLICDIGELAGMFEKSRGLDTFLQTAVGMVAYHMRAAVCSVYLYDEKAGSLMLTANQGLNPAAIGKMQIKPGEGLTGLAFSEQRPIRDGRALENPLFKYAPELGEEKYQAFLAVPIILGTERIGVLAVQDPVVDYFDGNDERALQAIASQLAAMVENTKLLMSLNRMQGAADKEPDLLELEAEPAFVSGSPASGGIGYGRALRLGEIRANGRTPSGVTPEEFQGALARTGLQLEALQRRLDERLADVASLIFSAHLLILRDERFSGEMTERIRAGVPAGDAISGVVEEYAGWFAKSSNPRLREKVQDVRDLGRRLLRNLNAADTDEASYKGCVVIASELMPSDLIKTAAQQAEAILLVGGGLTSHVAIIARSMQIPMVMSSEKRLLTLNAETMLLVDGDQGHVHVDPRPEVVENFKALEKAQRDAPALARRMMPETVTRDGARIMLMANVNLLSELAMVRQFGADGVGLYRSEFPFIARNDFPSEEEQYRLYRRIFDETDGMPVVFRTLDVGGDKMLSYFQNVSEANPFLGLRAIRFSLRNKDVFCCQLRAMLRAGLGARLRIMFPLVSSVDDFEQARSVVFECAGQLRAEGVPHNASPELGAMIELPSAVAVAAELAKAADFLSIGSNDLIQYTLAVDRTNQHISDLFIPHHPAVLRSMARVVRAARNCGKPVSLCGEMASNPAFARFLIGIGLRSFSMEVRSLPAIQKSMTEVNAAEAEQFAGDVLRLARIRDVADRLGLPR